MGREKRDIFKIVVLLAFVSLFLLSTMPCTLSPTSFTISEFGGSREPSAPISVGGAPYPGLWLSGDAHIHTNFSDGWPRTVEDRAREATENDLDFIIITDHTYYYLDTREELDNYYNTIKNVDSAYPDVKVLPGLEVDTFPNEYIDMLAYGLTADDFEPYMTAQLTPQQFATVIQNAGGVAYMAHPTTGFQWIENLTGFEGFNGGTLLINYILQGMWDQALIAGKRYFAIGNTDAHGDIDGGIAKREAGQTVATFVYCPNETEAGIVEGYRRGCIYFSQCIPVGSDYRPLFRMQFTVNDTWMGQTLTVPTAKSTLRLWINVTIAEGNTTIDSVYIVQDGKLTQRILGGGSSNVTQYLDLLDFAYTTDSYFRIYAKDSKFRYVVSNPVFLKRTYIKKVPAEYPTIQGAINAANPRDMIIVSPGTYYEHVIVNKSVSLIGENKHNTIIDGNDTGTVINVTATSVNISGFTIRGSGEYESGIYAYYSGGNNISHNIITNNWYGIWLNGSNHNILSDNIASANYHGILLYCSSHNILAGNNASANNYDGIRLDLSNNNTLTSNVASSNNVSGVHLIRISCNNTIASNTASNNLLAGLALTYSSDYNVIFHNNFINNGAGISQSVNTWDNNYEGNYWSDYNGTDANQDGIGDTPYIIDENNTDNYPLMEMFSDFTVTFEGTNYHVTTICNSTLSNFQFNALQKMISFNVIGADGTVGFCRITIPNLLIQQLWKGNYTVLVDEKQPIMFKNWTDGTNTYLYFTYIHTTHKVTIVPAKAEHPPIIIDGNPSDWIGTAPETNQWAYSGGEGIWTDEVGDDTGNGSYTYPTNPVFTGGDADLTEFRIHWNATHVMFLLRFVDITDAGWLGASSPYLTDIQAETTAIAICIDIDQKDRSGYWQVDDGRNSISTEINLTSTCWWEYLFEIILGDVVLWRWDSSSRSVKMATRAIPTAVDVTLYEAIEAAVPISASGLPDPTGQTWRFFVFVGLQDYGVFREIASAEVAAITEWAPGGGEGDYSVGGRGPDPDAFDAAFFSTKAEQEAAFNGFTEKTRCAISAYKDIIMNNVPEFPLPFGFALIAIVVLAVSFKMRKKLYT